ncbi:MAG TPA: glycosyltransferase family 2 protein [Planctomycetaceae bacterium]|jgi:dolichol-phosphate mannosyltransferase|nr:glycosyltransferase family 2 protein [Planctomycetaceae bacterium]
MVEVLAGDRVAHELPRLSVVFSFRNEEANIPELLHRTRLVLRREAQRGTLSGYELIFVNDASTDGSLDLLRRAADEQGDVRVVNMSRTFGHDPCLLAGMEMACGDLVVCLDTDLQDPPELISELLRVWKENPDVQVVNTVRCSRAGESRTKLWITALGYRILRTVSSIDLPIESGDFKLLTRRAVDEMVRLREKQPFFRGMTRWIGFRQLEVPYDREPRFAGRASPVMSRRVIRYFLESALIAFSGVPLQISTALGLLTSVVGVFVLLYAVGAGWSGSGSAGWIGLLSAVLIVGGLQMLMLGAIGLYLYSVYVELKRRPNYIVEGTLGFASRGVRSAFQNPGDSLNSEPAESRRPVAFASTGDLAGCAGS